MLPSLAFTFVVATALSACWLRLVSKVTGERAIPLSDLLLITGLCAGLSLLPGPGWLVAAIFMGLLVTRAERLDVWPEASLMVGGSAFIWLFAAMALWY